MPPLRSALNEKHRNVRVGITLEIRKLNTLRGLAAIIVLITHFSDVTGWLGGSLGGRAGQYGVMLFFLLSGFLMSYLYFDKELNKESVKSYILARAGRVIPLYLLVVFSSYLLYTVGLEGLYEITDVEKLIAHLAFIYGESVLWTIGPEIQFYFIFIGLWFLAAWRPGYIYVLAVASLIFLFFTNFLPFYGDVHGIPYNFFHLSRSLPYFLVGVILGMNYKSFKVPDYLRKNLFVAALLLIPLMYPQLSPVISEARMRMWLSYEVLLVMTSVFFCIVYLVPDNNILLANIIGDFLGKISYSLYLLHMPITVQLNKLGIPVEFKFILFISLSILVAYVSYRCLEKPLAKLVSNRSNLLSQRDVKSDAPA